MSTRCVIRFLGVALSLFAACATYSAVVFAQIDAETASVEALDFPILFSKQHNYQGLHIYDAFFQYRPGGEFTSLKIPRLRKKNDAFARSSTRRRLKRWAKGSIRRRLFLTTRSESSLRLKATRTEIRNCTKLESTGRDSEKLRVSSRVATRIAGADRDGTTFSRPICPTGESSLRRRDIPGLFRARTTASPCCLSSIPTEAISTRFP